MLEGDVVVVPGVVVVGDFVLEVVPVALVFEVVVERGVRNMIPSRMRPMTINTAATVPLVERALLVPSGRVVVVFVVVVRRSSGRGERSAMHHLSLTVCFPVTNGAFAIWFRPQRTAALRQIRGEKRRHRSIGRPGPHARQRVRRDHSKRRA